MRKFDLEQKVSSSLALMLVVLLSFLVAWFSVSAGEDILNSAPKSKILNPGKIDPFQQ